MKSISKLSAALCLAALAGLAPEASAQKFSLQVGKAKSNGYLGVSYSSGPGSGFGIHYAKGPGLSYGKGSYGKGFGFKPYCAPKKVWVPACYKTVRQKVWVPGCSKKVWIDPVYATECDYLGNSFQVLVSAGYWQVIEEPGHFEVQPVKVYQPGFWKVV